ncbi:rhodanese-like domain-containing protein [Gimesia panareensis]|uniref:Putative adenylyltransferase/sulfurtransferase MoeZ n=1 Tax=Gimesia panareensis TaxID=2527978 RepID=A0A517QFX4_9PLAN|nr:rhodanese-like domain-containing protein [Gimesia panareensis]QDT30437.1 putative adenylyltransferase/sulfurtransferase MoeZ [Gimesia panareensis]QDU53498.1 putative adenylyltransferase/sulfurtransferase MoeZ [Gimesia panareensis]
MGKSHSQRFLDIVNDAKSRVTECTVLDVQARTQNGDEFHLIDVREDHEFNAARIPGAKHLGKGIIERDIEKAIPETSALIILYCGGGFRSALAADNLQKMGYTQVISMDGGFSGWKNAGFEIESGE